MHTQVTSKTITLSESMKEYIESSIESFSKYGTEIISAVGVVSKEGKNIKFEITLTVPKQGVIVAKDVSSDFYKAVDSVVDKLDLKLSQIHEKKTQIHREKIVFEEEEILEEEAG